MKILSSIFIGLLILKCLSSQAQSITNQRENFHPSENPENLLFDVNSVITQVPNQENKESKILIDLNNNSRGVIYKTQNGWIKFVETTSTSSFMNSEKSTLIDLKKQFCSFRGIDTLFSDDGIVYSSLVFSSYTYWAQKFTPGVECTLKAALIKSDGGGYADLYIWVDSVGLPGKILAGPISFQSTSWPNWDSVTLPNIATSSDFWIGINTSYPPDLCMDKKCDYPERIVGSEDGINWHLNSPGGDFLFRTLCVFTGERHDITVIRASSNPGPLLSLQDSVKISTIIRNLGTVIEDSCPITYIVNDENQNIVFSDTIIAPPLAPYNLDTINFDECWRPTQIGDYKISTVNLLVNDMVSDNNLKKIKGYVLVYPSVFHYDDGSMEGGIGLSLMGRCAMKFTPPYYPCKVESLKLYLVPFQKAYGLIIDDNGQNGSPGRILALDSICDSTGTFGWRTIEFSQQNIVIVSGSFYAAYQNPPNTDCWFLSDRTEPLTGLDWTFRDGLWHPEEEFCGEFAIRVTVNYPTDISEEKNRSKQSAFKIVPNPAMSNITFVVSFYNKAVLKIYNSMGQIVKHWDIDGDVVNKIVWDGCDTSGKKLSSGVYFAYFVSNSIKLSREFILLQCY